MGSRTDCLCVSPFSPSLYFDEADFSRPNDADMYPTSLATAVSTSNHLVQEDVTVETDVPVVWTMEVRGGAE
jgi:hypothetical protein